MARPLLALAAGFFGVAVAVAGARPVLAPDFSSEEPAAPPIDVVALFHTHCASCHGETGDGKGWTELDRPARSFKDGGFSFGNTAETIARTITGGIPGTPMPGFDAALSADEIAALAKHVIALGPPELPKPERTEMIVLDRPLVARGKLPPIVRGAPERPRGLLVGTLDGLTFEYDAEDVRLVGVRQGRFVDRRDWGDRGGAALEPLGKPVYVVEDGKPGAPFAFHAGSEDEPAPVDLVANLAGTRVVEGRVSVLQTLRAADGAHVASVEETPKRFTTRSASGFRQTFSVRSSAAGELHLRLPLPGSRQVLANSASLFDGTPPGARPFQALFVPQSEGASLHVLVPVGSSGPFIAFVPGEESRIVVRIQPGGASEFELLTILLPSADVEAAFQVLLELSE